MHDYKVWPDGKIGEATKQVFEEYKRAEKNYPPFNSAHEGYAVLLEEVDELWTLVKEKQIFHDKHAMRSECVQIAAMALRFITDVCDKDEK